MMMACQGNVSEETFCFDEMTYSPTETVFKLFAPADAKCFVVIGDDSLLMTKASSARPLQEGAVFRAAVKGDQKGKEYVFVVNGAVSPGVFAKAVTVNGKKGVVVDMRDSDPAGWADDVSPRLQNYQDWIVYEMHHRDFSVARADAEHPGKFLALTEPWAISHLKELGITAVHILPSYDFGSVDETRLDEPQYNWGYDPVNYNVPEGSYSTDPTDPLCRVREFKQMVQALHQAGICVVLDVVYNHTYDIDHSNFQRTYPDYYYRKVKAPLPAPDAASSSQELQGDEAPSGTAAESWVYSNGSGCGNETASEKEMMRMFMLESVKYWHNEYHIDGFRFDLMGCHDIETMNAIRQMLDELDPTIFVYGEGWSAGQCALPAEQLGLKANIPQMPRIAAFSDDMRDALRGPFSDDTKGAFLAGIAGEEESLKAGLAGMTGHPQVDYTAVNYSDEPYATEPTQMIAYVSCHDDMCLTDRLRASIPAARQADKAPAKAAKAAEETLIHLDLLAQTAVFTSQGVPFMLSGEELLRTKQGVHNSFESPDAINQLDWTNKERYPQVFEYYKKLIALRKHHPAFRLGTAALVAKHLEFLPVQDCLVAFRITNAPADEWHDIIVILNANSKAMNVEVPEGEYTVVCSGGQIDEQGIGKVSGPAVSAAPQSAMILRR